MCLAMSHGMGQQQQQRAMLTGVVYANAAAQLMKMIYVSSAHQANNTADIDSASSLYHDYVSLHFYHARPTEAIRVAAAHRAAEDEPAPLPPKILEKSRRACQRISEDSSRPDSPTQCRPMTTTEPSARAEGAAGLNRRPARRLRRSYAGRPGRTFQSARNRRPPLPGGGADPVAAVRHGSGRKRILSFNLILTHSPQFHQPLGPLTSLRPRRTPPTFTV